MRYWLIKSEPSTYSWQDLEKEKLTKWDGVRNYQAQNNMKAMKIGDLALFYHSIKEKAVVGIAQVSKEHYMDNDPKFGQVDVKFYKPLKRPVTLQNMKENDRLKNLKMIKQSRLSVSEVDEDEWCTIMEMAEKD